MTNDEQIIKAALDMAAMAAVTTPESRPGAPREWSDGFTSGCLHSADAIRAIDPADVLAKVGVTSTNLEPPRLMAMCGHCRSAGEEYCVQYLTDLRWDGAEWCCKDCFDGSGENGDWDEATQPCPQPAPDAVARLVNALESGKSFAESWIEENGGIDGCDYQDRVSYENICAVLAACKAQLGED